MLTLYVRTGCPYCAEVLEEALEMGIEFDMKNIATPGIEEELEARGGKMQVPYLIDSETGKEMYESDAIITYLHERFGKTT
jgi:glutathione S-transferase